MSNSEKSSAGFKDEAGTYYPSLESVRAYMPMGRTLVRASDPDGDVLRYAMGEWHQALAGRKHVRCRIAVDFKQAKLIAAQAWTGDRFEAVAEASFAELAAAIIDSEPPARLSSWDWVPAPDLPAWATQGMHGGDDVATLQRRYALRSFNQENPYGVWSTGSYWRSETPKSENLLTRREVDKFHKRHPGAVVTDVIVYRQICDTYRAGFQKVIPADFKENSTPELREMARAAGVEALVQAGYRPDALAPTAAGVRSMDPSVLACPLSEFFAPMQLVGTLEGGDEPKIALVVGGMEISDPWKSDCGRFAVNPMQAHGLSEASAHLLGNLPDGQVKFPHPWPPQIPPGRTTRL